MPIEKLVLEGQPRQRGRIYGETMRAAMYNGISRWKARLGEQTRESPDAFIHRLVGDNAFDAAVIRWTPELMEEVVGIGEGSGLDWETVFAYQLMDEIAWCRRTAVTDLLGIDPVECTAMGAVSSDGAFSLVAQTLDLSDLYRGQLVLLHIKPSDTDLEQMILAPVGQLGSAGLNNHSVGAVANGLHQLNHSQKGLPVGFVVRSILSQLTLVDASSFVQSIQHASGQNYLIGSPTEILDFECSGEHVVQYGLHASALCHTNHPLSNLNTQWQQTGDASLVKDRNWAGNAYINSVERYEAGRTRLDGMMVHPNVEAFQAALSSHDSDEHPICRHPSMPGASMTVAGVVLVLSGTPGIYVCEGPPCSNPFTAYTFEGGPPRY